MTSRLFRLVFLALVVLSFGLSVFAEESAPSLVIPEGAQAAPNFDALRATEAWVGTLSPEQRAKSDAYFEGGYVLQLVEILGALGLAALFLLTPLSRRMRALAERMCSYGA